MTEAEKFAPKDRPVITPGVSPRRSLLDLAPLELDCMNTLWPIGEGTVREIRDLLAPRRPRAYTTIMTIMDRLARKGVVERRKSGRAYIYRANLSADDARRQALGQVVENFFGGSSEDVVAFLRSGNREASLAVTSPVSATATPIANPETATPARALAAAAAAGVSATVAQVSVPSAPAMISEKARGARDDSHDAEPATMDETLL
ncbi:MAG TPA: BlaI/MecI/CopY family transcriptional regulator [Candidatus Acidoferrales bacterium]